MLQSQQDLLATRSLRLLHSRNMAETFANTLLSIKLSRRLLLHSLQGSSHSNPNNNGQQCSLTQAHNQKRRKISKSVRMTGQMTLLAYSAMMEVHSYQLKFFYLGSDLLLTMYLHCLQTRGTPDNCPKLFCRLCMRHVHVFSCMHTVGRKCSSFMNVQHCSSNLALLALKHSYHPVTGTIMFCDGSCMRAFHCGVEKLLHESTSDGDEEAHERDPPDSPTKLQAFSCNPLDMPLDLYQHLKDTKDTFHCPNCLAGVHQCFKCKLEGVVETHAADPHNASFANQVVYR